MSKRERNRKIYTGGNETGKYEREGRKQEPLNWREGNRKI